MHPESIFSISSSDLAAWVQAVGSILAIVASAWIAIAQSKESTHQLNQQLRHQEDQRAKEEKARVDEEARKYRERLLTFNEIVTAAVDCQRRVQRQLRKPEAVAAARDNQITFLPEIEGLERALNRIEVHLLPERLVSPTIKVAAIFAEFRKRVSYEIDNFGHMGADGVARFAHEMDRIQVDLEAALLVIEMELGLDDGSRQGGV